MSRNYFYSTFAPSSLSLSPPSSFSHSRSRRHRGKGTRKVGSHKLNLPVTIHSREKSTRIFEPTSANLLNLRTRDSLRSREVSLENIRASYPVRIHQHRDIGSSFPVSFRPFLPDFDSTFLPSNFTRFLIKSLHQFGWSARIVRNEASNFRNTRKAERSKYYSVHEFQYKPDISFGYLERDRVAEKKVIGISQSIWYYVEKFHGIGRYLCNCEMKWKEKKKRKRKLDSKW